MGSTGSMQRTQWRQLATAVYHCVPLRPFHCTAAAHCSSVSFISAVRHFQPLGQGPLIDIVRSGGGTVHTVPSTAISPGCITTHVESVTTIQVNNSALRMHGQMKKRLCLLIRITYAYAGVKRQVTRDP